MKKKFPLRSPLIVVGFIIKYYEIRLLKFDYSKIQVIHIKKAGERIQKK